MFRSLRPNSDFSVPGAADDSDILLSETVDSQDEEEIFLNLTNEDNSQTSRSRSSTVLGVDCYNGLHFEEDPDNVCLAGAGDRRYNNSANVKDSKIGSPYYLVPDRKQDLDFCKFEAHIHKTSSIRDFSESSDEDCVFSMAPVIVSPMPSIPTGHSFNFRNMQPDMLGKKKKSRGYPNSLGFLTPSGLRTPTGMQTPTGIHTPTGSAPPTLLRRSTSIADLIHYHTLENVNISDLYSQNNPDPHFSEDNTCVNINQNVPQSIDLARPSSRYPQRSDRSHFDKKFKSHSCPHSRHHSPPRQRYRIETVNETEGSLPDIVTASSGCNVGFDINFNDLDDYKIINPVDDSLTSAHDVDSAGYYIDSAGHYINSTGHYVEPAGQAHDCSYHRHKDDSVSFASLFHRCRFERDTSVPNTPCEGDGHQVDPEQLINRVNDFLCAERVSQMTKTYNDIEAVTRLLEEKERDLELAARIGQTLLSKNKELNTRSESLEEQLTVATDKVNQLRHDIVMKDDLLRFYNENLDHENSDESIYNDRSGPQVSLDFLEKKVKTLEDENISLRVESAVLKSDTDSLEQKEKKLVEDCIQQLADVNLQVEVLANELHEKAEENAHYKVEIAGLLEQVADLQKKIRKLTQENMKIHEELIASSETHRKLTEELGDMKDRNDEYYEMLKEAQDELRMLRGKKKVFSSGQHHHSAYNVPTDSLASELETSLQDGFLQTNKKRSQKWKVFETAKAAKRAAAKAAQRETSSGTRISLRESDSRGPSAYPSDVESLPSDDYNADLESLYGSNSELGQPGIPGSNDLVNKLKKLAMRRANEPEMEFQDEEEERRRKIRAAMSAGTSPCSVRSPNPWGLRSPAGSLSSSNWSSSVMNNHHYKLSDKLQIIKPMEGSMTLRHWQHLATPNLGGIFEERDGVQIKGEKKIDPIDGIYSLSDFEEDDDMHHVHTREDQDIGMAYTYTNSTPSSPGSHMDADSFLGTSTPVAVYVNTDEQASGTNFESQHIHVTQQHTQPDNNSQSTHKPLGLASLFQGREDTDVRRALMRVSALKKAAISNENSSSPVPNSDLNMMSLSARSFGSSSPSSSPRNIPGSRSFDQAMREYEEKRMASESKSTKKPELFAPGMTGKGFLQQLKSKGYSLYGLWGGGTKDSQSGGTESSTDAATQAGDGAKATNESTFTNGAGVGVLGALTNFRRNGMF